MYNKIENLTNVRSNVCHDSIKKTISYGILVWTLLYYKKPWGHHWGNKQLCQKIFKIYNYDNVSKTLDKRVKIFIRKSFQNDKLSPWYNIFVTSKSYRPCLPNVNRLGILPNITSFLINGIFCALHHPKYFCFNQFIPWY